MKAASVFIALSLLTALPTCEPKIKTVPDQLLGVWKTKDARYADRSLEFTPQSVTFSTGGSGSQTYTIDEIEKVSVKSETLYTITYMDTHLDEYRLSFFFHGTDGGMLSFKNQPELIWKRAEEKS